MNISFISNLLTVSPLLGILWLVLLFIACFICVHITRLVKFGWLYQRRPYEKPKPPEQTEKKAPEKTPSAEPVYYIVERKRKTRQSYSEPKEIRFK
ncbi:MAG: hypothetical protein IJX96_03970 [Clostridia bacterium]|nr:hypothetical protein [Clostridia bacterium]